MFNLLYLIVAYKDFQKITFGDKIGKKKKENSFITNDHETNGLSKYLWPPKEFDIYDKAHRSPWEGE